MCFTTKPLYYTTKPRYYSDIKLITCDKRDYDEQRLLNKE